MTIDVLPIPRLTVAELIEAGEAGVQTGPFGTQLKASEYVETGTPVINVRNVGFGKIRDADLEYVNEAKAYALRAHHLREGDIVFGRKGAVERHALINRDSDGWIQGSDCLRLRVDSKRVIPKYLSYYFRTQGHQDWMQALCSFGATMSSLNQDIVKRISFPCPPLEIQRKIAGVLSAYDDLIENNRRRIAILENMAEEIYREWFVRMRFPGHQNAKFEKGVPEGWEVKPFDAVVSIKPTEHVVHGEEYTFVAMDKLSCNSFYFHCDEKRLHPSGSRFRNGDVLFPRITPSVENGKRGFVTCLAEGRIGVGSTEFIVMREKEICKEHLFFVTCSDVFRTHAEQSMVGASGRQRVHEKCFSSFLVKTPPNGVRKQFVKAVSPFFLSIVSLSRQSSLLERKRNSLLARLISGKLPVDELDIQLPPSMTDDAAEEASEEPVHA
ncbi:restriction endonuclease subunit S [Crateriforma conspicua]|uniref:restriction endonuclease subunit S n=1 Tax=Crateriforma conspicua TaxID=2527996 RepID=UPI0011882249|nr:restriction endonuclease subunit S [Crateriforma conspicua]QDV62649.1 EcoKI restriction-modification system protein HsdS [Crateriforma conspicua]